MKWEKSTALKIVIGKKWFYLIVFVSKRRDMSFMTYQPSYKQIGHYMGRETVYCNLSSNMVEGEGCHVLAAR